MTRLGELEVHEQWAGVEGDGERVVPFEDLLAHTRSDGLGRYRPLTGARTLPRGWRVEFGDGASVEAVIETVYPLAVVHQRQWVAGTLRVVSLDEVLRRQSGRYESTAALSAAGRRLAIETVCGICVRRPVWDGAVPAAGEIPCPEPCSVLVAFCREAALWEADPPPAQPADPAVPFAAFDEPGNELRERYLSRMSTPE